MAGHPNTKFFAHIFCDASEKQTHTFYISLTSDSSDSQVCSLESGFIKNEISTFEVGMDSLQDRHLVKQSYTAVLWDRRIPNLSPAVMHPLHPLGGERIQSQLYRSRLGHRASGISTQPAESVRGVLMQLCGERGQECNLGGPRPCVCVCARALLCQALVHQILTKHW